MLDIKTFRDGSRFVVVFDGFGDDFPDMEKIVASVLGGIVPRANVEPAPQSEAKPIPVDTAESITIPTATFESGPYKGLTPDEVIKTDKARGFKYLAYLDGDTVDSSLKESVDAAIKDYLKNFAGCDADKYSHKLSVAQREQFFSVYFGILPEDIRKRAHGNEEEQTKAIADSIRYFQSI